MRSDQVARKEMIRMLIKSLKKEQYKKYFIILTLFFLVLFEYFIGNSLYALLTVVLFLGLLIFRKPNFLFFAIIISVIGFFGTESRRTLNNLAASNLSTIESPKSSVNNILFPNSGQEVLPVRVQQMVYLLELHNISNYQISEQLSSNGLINQRITEVAWPIRKTEKSHYLLTTIDEKQSYSNCTMIGEKGKVALVYCH